MKLNSTNVVLVAVLMNLLLMLFIMFDVETLVGLLVIVERRISTQTNTEYADLNSVLLNLSYGHVTHPAHTFKKHLRSQFFLLVHAANNTLAFASCQDFPHH